MESPPSSGKTPKKKPEPQFPTRHTESWHWCGKCLIWSQLAECPGCPLLLECVLSLFIQSPLHIIRPGLTICWYSLPLSMISQTVHFYLSAVGSRRRAMTRHHYGRLSFTGGNLGKKRKRNRGFRRYLRDRGVDVVSVWVFPGLNLSNMPVSP